MNVGNILGQDIQSLDDSLIEIEGESTWRVGCNTNL